MSSYLNIYLEKNGKEGEDKGERLLLTSISRADDLYHIFYDNSIGIPKEDNYHEFTVKDLDSSISEINTKIEETRNAIIKIRNTLPYIQNKDAIVDITETIVSHEDYIDDLARNKLKIDAICSLFADIGEEWVDFNKLYWKVE